MTTTCIPARALNRTLTELVKLERALDRVAAAISIGHQDPGYDELAAVYEECTPQIKCVYAALQQMVKDTELVANYIEQAAEKVAPREQKHQEYYELGGEG